MKAILVDDRILKLTLSDEGVEIGSIPQEVGLERLRFNGKKVVDLMDLDSIWVELVRGCFMLHAVPVRDSTLVEMNYSDRKLLINDDGDIRIKTEEEVEEEQGRLRKHRKLHKIKKELETGVGTELEQSITTEKLIYIIVKALVDKSSEHIDFLFNYLQKMENFVDIDIEKDTILKSLENKKNVISQLDIVNEEDI